MRNCIDCGQTFYGRADDERCADCQRSEDAQPITPRPRWYTMNGTDIYQGWALRPGLRGQAETPVFPRIEVQRMMADIGCVCEFTETGVKVYDPSYPEAGYDEHPAIQGGYAVGDCHTDEWREVED